MDDQLLEAYINNKKHVQYARLSKDSMDLWQPLYGSQSYGTFYRLYGKLIPDCSDDNVLSKIQFKIVNYKGLINLGISRIDHDEHDERGNIYNIVVRLRGLEPNDKMVVEPDYEFDFSEPAILCIKRILEPLNGFQVKGGGNPYNGEVFDEEYYYRDSEKNVRDPFELDRSNEFYKYRTGIDPKDEINGFPCIRSIIELFK